jgi:hypothetical protein
MKIAAAFIALGGVLSFLSFPVGVLSATSSRWPVSLAYSILGAWLIWIAFGIWKRRIAAWRHGFAAIVLSSVAFVVQVCLDLPAVSTNQKAVIIISCSVGGILFGAYWSFIWYRQKNWFAHETVA